MGDRAVQVRTIGSWLKTALFGSRSEVAELAGELGASALEQRARLRERARPLVAARAVDRTAGGTPLNPGCEPACTTEGSPEGERLRREVAALVLEKLKK